MRIREALLTAQLAYGAAFVWHSSLVEGGVRWFLLFDDAMISMQYARTLAAGFGFVWFPGAEPVLGITNPLWALLMVPVHALGLPAQWASLPIQLAGVAIAAGAGLAAGRLHGTLRPGTPRAWLSQAAVGFFLPLVVWGGLGVEAALLALLLLVALESVLRDLRAGRVGFLAPALLAAGVGVRLDFAPLAAVPALGVAVAGWRAGRPGRGLGLAALPFAAAAAVCALQALVYGEPLPNTVALKLGVPLATRAARGADVAWHHLGALGGPFLLVGLGALVASRRAPPAARLAVPALLAAAFAYNVYVGGDAWEWAVSVNRFLLPVAPLAIVSVAFALDAALARWAPGRAAAAAVCALLVLGLDAGFALDPQRALRRLGQALLLLPAPMREEHDRGMLRAGLLLREASTRPLTVAVTSAGIAPYVLGRGRFVDVLGKSDRRVARLPPQPGPYLPGHVKWDFAWSLRTLRPEVAVGDWAGMGGAFREPVVRLPGDPDLFVRRAVLETAFVPAPELAALHRRLDYGPQPALLRSLLRMRGLREAGDGTRLALADEGSLRVPARSTVSFRIRAAAPVEIAVSGDARPDGALVLLRGETRRLRYTSRSGARVELRARRPADAEPAAAAVVSGLTLEPAERS